MLRAISFDFDRINLADQKVDHRTCQLIVINLVKKWYPIEYIKFT